MKFIDLFAGIGGFHYGFKRAGYECVMSSEINENATNTYAINHGHTPWGDITKIEPSTIPDHDVLVAGFPCQPFSICGRKMGFEDTRGTMFFFICKIIEEKKPSVVLLENVKFLLHHDGGKTLQVILNSLDELGYTVNYSLQNAVHYGVAQNRERVIIIASRKNKFDFAKLPHRPIFSTIRDIMDDESPHMEYLSEKEYTLIENPIKQKASGLKFVGYRNKSIRKAGVREDTEHLSRVHKQPNRIYSIDGTHPTLPSQEASGRFFIHNPDTGRVRKLTVNECYKLMGFPNDFIINTSKAEAYKQIGNSVCVPMAQELANQIRMQILENNHDESSNYIEKTIRNQMRLCG